MSLRRSSLVSLLFALLFLCAQQQAVLHLLGHSLERIEQKKDAGGPDESFCAKCLAVAHLDHAVSTGSVDVAASSFTPPRTAAVRNDEAPTFFVAVYQSRAPPTFS